MERMLPCVESSETRTPQHTANKERSCKMKLLSLLLMAGTVLVAQATAQGRRVPRAGHPSQRVVQSHNGGHRLQLRGHPGLHLRVGTPFYLGHGRPYFGHRYYKYYPHRRHYPYRRYYSPRRYYRRHF